MNAINKMIEATASGLVHVKNIFFEENYQFFWNKPATEAEIEDFSKDAGFKIPPDYRELLMATNGAVIFKSKYEDDGYRLLSLRELKIVNQELKNVGYDIPDGYLCFCQCLFSEDILLIDSNRNKNYIVDGDMGYPCSMWKHLSGDFNSFLINLCLCNGSNFWRW